MRFSEDFISDLKFRNDIENIVSRYIALKPSGSARSIARCPFHGEKTPSFTVFKANQSFYCFGCGIGGDVVTFIMRIENLDYISAVSKLAEWVGLPLPVNKDNGEKLASQRRLYELNREAAKYFHYSLMSEAGKEALEYLHGRNLQNATIKHFGIGYAPESWDALTKAMTAKGFTHEELKEAFLAGTSRTGGYIDYFRGRIIFPILDLQKRVIAFGGRAMGDAKPKYLNTSDTGIFKKSNHLYALNFVKDVKKDCIILCEGYMDTIALHQAGFNYAVATLGTAVTSEHANIVGRYAKKAVLCYDSDEAGRRASEKAAELLRRTGVEVKILNVRGAKDPDEFISKYGADRFKVLIDESKGYIEEKIEVILAKHDTTSDNGRVKAAAELCGEIAKLDSQIEQEVYGTKVADILNIAREPVIREIKRLRKRGAASYHREEISMRERQAVGIGDRINPGISKNPRAASAESQLIGILLNYPEYFNYIKEKITPDLFFTEFNRKIFIKFMETMENLSSSAKFDASYIFEDFTPEETGKIMKMKLDREKESNNNETEIDLKIQTLAEEKEKENIKNTDVYKLEDDEWRKMIRG